MQTLVQLLCDNLDANLLFHQRTTESAILENMGVMIPYSTQLITKKYLELLRTIECVTEVMGTALILNFLPVKIFSAE